MKNYRGQMLVIALLIASVMAVIGASVATQVVNEQRRIRIEERTERAFYAAEAGLEKAIEALNNNPAGLDGGKTVQVGEGSNEVSVVIAKVDDTPSTVYEYPAIFTPGMNGFFNFDDNGTPFTNPTRLCWDGTNSAIQVQFYYDPTDPKMQTILRQSGMVLVGVDTDDGTTGILGYPYCMTIPTNTAANPDFLVFWVWGENTNVVITSDTNLPAQGKTITAIARITDPDNGSTITRRVKRYSTNRRYPPAYMFLNLIGNEFSFGQGKNW